MHKDFLNCKSLSLSLRPVWGSKEQQPTWDFPSKPREHGLSAEALLCHSIAGHFPRLPGPDETTSHSPRLKWGILSENSFVKGCPCEGGTWAFPLPNQFICALFIFQERTQMSQHLPQPLHAPVTSQHQSRSLHPV